MSNLTVVNQETSGLMPSSSDWAMMKEQGTMLVQTGFLPKAVNTPQKAVAIMLKGRELNLPPMQALAQINVIQGKPTISSELMLALIFRAYPKTKLKYIQNDDEACIIEITKPGNEPNRFSFTFADAKAARLTSKDNWNTYRRAMLRSRCISEMARSLFPEALMGCSYTPEEIEDTVQKPAKAQPVQLPKDSGVTEVPVRDRAEKMINLFTSLPGGDDASGVQMLLEDYCNGVSIDDFGKEQFERCGQLYKDIKSGKTTLEKVAHELNDAIETNETPLKDADAIDAMFEETEQTKQQTNN